MNQPLRIHAFWATVGVAIVSLGARSRPPRSPAPSERELLALRSEVDQLRSLLVEIEGKVQYVTVESKNINGVSGPHMIITGCNLHVRSGSGFTTDEVAGDENETDDSENSGAYSGLGNLIVGYNEGTVGLTDRQGSHNLVIGSDHKFTSCGGLVAGESNSITGRFATVTGGYSNTASGLGSSVTGGTFNTALGLDSSVSGGYNNKAEKGQSSVSGGIGNTTSGLFSSISGGRRNKTSDSAASISGGSFNEASAYGASVSGGYRNKAVGKGSSVGSGMEQTDAENLFDAIPSSRELELPPRQRGRR
jgi:hypothetical protein